MKLWQKIRGAIHIASVGIGMPVLCLTSVGASEVVSVQQTGKTDQIRSVSAVAELHQKCEFSLGSVRI